jgi:hypothetical protein
VSRTSPASSILTRVAREVLGSLGLRQKGRSRLWIDDRGWWLVVVELQPSSWSQGSGLNVAGMWLWMRADHIHFDTKDSHRSEYVEFRDEAQFEPAARRLAELAAGRVRGLRERFPSPEAVAQHQCSIVLDGGWPAYHAGVAAGLTGDVARARATFEGIASAARPDSPEWHRELCGLAAELRERCADRAAFRAWASDVVAESRRLLKLDALTSPAFSSGTSTPPSPARVGARVVKVSDGGDHLDHLGQLVEAWSPCAEQEGRNRFVKVQIVLGSEQTPEVQVEGPQAIVDCMTERFPWRENDPMRSVAAIRFELWYQLADPQVVGP